MEKLCFEFTVLPASDGKSSICCLTSIATIGGKVYALPEELQSVSHHKELIKTTVFNKVKNSLKKRYQTRRVWISMNGDLKKTYLDEDENLQFEDQYLEEVQVKTAVAQDTQTGVFEKLFEQLVQNTQESTQQNLKQITEKFLIEKFTSKNPNANRWIDTFEKECTRFSITEDDKKIEALRLLMDKCCTDWYNSMIIKYTIDSDWTTWKNIFCETFTNKGWTQISYALSFKYRDGLLLDYAIKKEKMLLEMRNSIDTGTIIDLIAVGLPEHVLNRIDRETLKDTVDLFNEVRKFEYLVNKRSYSFYRKHSGNSKGYNINDRNEEKNSCKICEKLNKGIRYHPESACWYRTKEEEKPKVKNIRHVNNSVIEAQLNEAEQKN
ncbi:hypothetical protein HW555_000034 [Spodoptera exigua]|uniref:Uncharacterized protein n=1 Tax=Spodoptera exigua TaxID=7107 RepID=A0A835L929_SPOEX|nr:hypothetical protein HW555_000034 [Spodoptera exigua]